MVFAVVYGSGENNLLTQYSVLCYFFVVNQIALFMDTTKNLPTVEELNRIQAEWMAIDPFAPEAEKKRVFKLMEQFPRTYVSGHDGKGVCNHDGQPTSIAIPFDDALARCKALGGRVDVAWHGGRGQWYAL